MLKRIIFDVDNTLLDSDKDCLDAYNEYFNIKNIDLDGDVLYGILDIYEEQNKLLSIDKNKVNNIYRFNFNIEDMSNFIRNNLSIDFDSNDFLELQNIYAKHSTLKNDKIIEVLDILSKKYELVALTKWFREPQMKRLEKAGLLNYFNEVYAFENAGIKPSKKAFITSMGDYAADECMVIGDSISSDIVIPKELGMNTIYINYNNRVTNEVSVNKFEDILNIIDSNKKAR